MTASRLLVVDDEPGYRDYLARYLTREGHEVQVAASGREAIDTGARFRPRVLIADWMLKDQLHGIHVSETLRVVRPDMQTIVITAFPSDDLRVEVARALVYRFITKPFELADLSVAVREAARVLPPRSRQASIAVIEVGPDGEVLYANPRARALFRETDAGDEPERFSGLFPAGHAPDLDNAAERWVVASPRTSRASTWHVRAQAGEGQASRFVVLRVQGEPEFAHTQVIEMLLRVEDPRQARWPFPGRVLVVDSHDLVRRSAVMNLLYAGAGCYAAETHADAIRLFEHDHGIEFVILDYDMPCGEAAALVPILRTIRPRVTIVGISAQDRSEAFRRMQVDYFLRKPWRVERLIHMVTGRIAECVGCGLPLPLRKALPGEISSQWACCACGSRYSAVLEGDCPVDVLANVRAVRE
ncbi:MAG: response regulator [Phycisphaerae bacterium]|nr:response regulator [Phycisphaerae bacterium]